MVRDSARQFIMLIEWLPTDGASPILRRLPDPQDPGKQSELWYIDGEPNMAQTLGLRLAEGRFLDPGNMGDAIGADDFDSMDGIRPCLMTASTARLLGVSELNRPLHKAAKIGRAHV